MRLSQGSPVSSILFFIYMSRVFDEVAEANLVITSLFFVNNLGFITACSSVKNFVKIFKRVVQVVINKIKFNAVIYNITKTEIVLFSKLYR